MCTIATHDLSLVQLPLSYTAGVAEDIRLTPLGYTDALTIKDFVSLLEANKPTTTRGGAKSWPSDKPSDPAAASLSKYVLIIIMHRKFQLLQLWCMKFIAYNYTLFCKKVISKHIVPYYVMLIVTAKFIPQSFYS